MGTVSAAIMSLMPCFLPGPSDDSKPFQSLTTVRVADGFQRPTFAVCPPGDIRRMVIGEQHTGDIRMLRDGVLLPDPFLQLGSVAQGLEQGLLSLAFDPNYETNRFFYILYTELGTNDVIIERYRTSSDPDRADPSSRQTVLLIPQPTTNHNGSTLLFGPRDGYLYITMGDGGPGADPQNNAQNGGSLLGKILRIDVSNGLPYEIPPDNPFVGPGDPLDEIWALGLRNPWRASFDSETGDLWFGDVGQADREEINFQPAESLGGENYGWRCLEGSRCTQFGGCGCTSASLTPPLFEYPHDLLYASVVGGYVYRGCAIDELAGTYFFGDASTGRIYSLRYDDGVSEFLDRTAELQPPTGTIFAPHSFGVDAFGELYIVDGLQGVIFKIVPRQSPFGSRKYGDGWPGSDGVPGLTIVSEPHVCSTITLVISSSARIATIGLLLIGIEEAHLPTPLDGTLLTHPLAISVLSLSVGRNPLPVDIPCEPAFCEFPLYSQALIWDPGASHGVAFTPGLEMRFGPPW